MLTIDQPNARKSVILAQDDDFLITYHEPALAARDDGKVVITFGTLQSDLATSGFGTNLMLNTGHATVYVAPRRGTQYQGLSLDAFYSALYPVTDGRPTVCYGASLGAYASMYYGGALNANILAAAPQLPAMPALGMRHAQTVTIVHEEMHSVPRSAGATFTLWDPHERPDNILVSEYIQQMYPDGIYHKMPFYGHKVLETLAAHGLVQKYILEVLESFQKPNIELPTEDSSIWVCNYGKKIFRDQNLETALTYFEKSFAIQPSPENIQLLAKTYKGLGLSKPAARLASLIRENPTIAKMTFNNARRDLNALLQLDATLAV